MGLTTADAIEIIDQVREALADLPEACEFAVGTFEGLIHALAHDLDGPAGMPCRYCRERAHG